MTEPYCWICEDPANREMCLPDEPGQLGLFDANRVLIKQELADADNAQA